MFMPNVHKKSNGRPILRKNEIDSIAEQFIADFCPEALKTPMAIDIERFAQNYLGLKQDFQYLSHNGVYLGMMIFNDTNKVPIYDPTTKRAEYVTEKARTIIIDNNLLNNDQEQRYRFTMGHEVAHDIFHSQYFSYNPDQVSLFDDVSPMVQCRIDTSKIETQPKSKGTDSDWMEWQANRFSSAILMPASMVRQLIESHPVEPGCWVLDVIHTFNVSMQAAEIRLNELGILRRVSQNRMRMS